MRKSGRRCHSAGLSWKFDSGGTPKNSGFVGVSVVGSETVWRDVCEQKKSVCSGALSVAIIPFFARRRFFAAKRYRKSLLALLSGVTSVGTTLRLQNATSGRWCGSSSRSMGYEGGSSGIEAV